MRNLARWGFATLGLVCAAQTLLTGCALTTVSCASFSSQTTGSEMGIVDSALGGNEVGQSFTLTSTYTVTSADLKLKKLGSPLTAATLTLTLRSDTGSGAPDSASILGTADSALVSTVTSTSGASKTFTFSTPVSLTAGTYWLVLAANYAASTTNLIQWIGYDGTSGYSGGNAAYETSTANTWSSTAVGAFRDLVFSLTCQIPTSS